MQSTMIAAPAGPEPSERISSYCTPSRPPAPRAIARWILSFGMLASAALSIAKRRRGLLFASPPPRRAATVISLIRLVQTRPRLASAAAFLCLILAHLEWPAILSVLHDEQDILLYISF